MQHYDRKIHKSTYRKELKLYEDSVNAYRDIVNAIRTAVKRTISQHRPDVNH